MAHNTYGERMRPDDGRAIPTFICQALRGEPLTVHGDGMQTRSVCYVEDLVRGILGLLDSDHPAPMNIGNPKEMSVRDLAKKIAKLAESPSGLTSTSRPEDDPTVRQPDISLARGVLGWEPHISADEGLRRTIDWFSAQPELVRRLPRLK